MRLSLIIFEARAIHPGASIETESRSHGKQDNKHKQKIK